MPAIRLTRIAARRSAARAASLALVALAALVTGTILGCGGDRDHRLILATTTSTENSGLLDVLIPRYEEQTGDAVRVIAVGSGAAIQMGERGDADVLLVHSPAAERAFVDAGFGIERTRVMFNDFVIAGPPGDPAHVASAPDAAEAMARIRAAGASFVSRGDDSGTHARERALWEAAGGAVPRGEPWYAESGQGMAATLTIATETESYAVTDRGTWLAVADRARLPILSEGDGRLLNVYHVIVVNPDRHEGVNADGARRFRDFLVDGETQDLIGAFGIEQFGQPLFFPGAE